ncbi:hypothetical protein AYI70_g9460 [Smittium culicis]|uniref:Uncharacterized protein n=1 Tax=Smittium culicis TaxID=133412 RepID=A0A1R1XB38_9FUNG|nr:hypothetical protein AYI70_g9460 [Smittium culicis]
MLKKVRSYVSHKLNGNFSSHDQPTFERISESDRRSQSAYCIGRMINLEEKTNNKNRAPIDTIDSFGRFYSAAHPTFYSTSGLEDVTGIDKNYFNFSMEIRGVIFGHENAFNSINTCSGGNRVSQRSKKLNFSAHLEQGPEIDGLEDQWSALAQKGLTETAITLILNIQLIYQYNRSIRRSKS